MTRNINEIEDLKPEGTKNDEVTTSLKTLRHQLSKRYLSLAQLFKNDSNQNSLYFDLTLTAFSLNPSENLHNILFPSSNVKESDLIQSNSVSTVLDKSIDNDLLIETTTTSLSSCEIQKSKQESQQIHLSTDLKDELQAVINSPRWSSLSWAKDREELQRLCQEQLDTGGPKVKSKEDLTHLHVDYTTYEPAQIDPDVDIENDTWLARRAKRCPFYHVVGFYSKSFFWRQRPGEPVDENK